MSRLIRRVSASLTLDHRYERQVIICDAADLTVTLPPANRASKGRRICVVSHVPSGGTGTFIDVASADKIDGSGIASAAAGKGAVNTGATDALGDLLEVESDGANVWYVVNRLGTWAREA